MKNEKIDNAKAGFRGFVQSLHPWNVHPSTAHSLVSIACSPPLPGSLGSTDLLEQCARLIANGVGAPNSFLVRRAVAMFCKGCVLEKLFTPGLAWIKTASTQKTYGTSSIKKLFWISMRSPETWPSKRPKASWSMGTWYIDMFLWTGFVVYENHHKLHFFFATRLVDHFGNGWWCCWWWWRLPDGPPHLFLPCYWKVANCWFCGRNLIGVTRVF